MGFFEKLLGGLTGGSTTPCPTCGADLDTEELREGSYWCGSCGTLYTEEAGDLVDVKSLRSGDGGSCDSCQSSLSGGTSYLPYEDGSNSEAYIVCPSCGHQNTR